MRRHLIQCCAVSLLVMFLAAGIAAQTQKLPVSLAGTIPTRPSGKIAFIRDGDVWIMEPDGSGQERAAEVKNADGRMSWSPDGRRIAYTRSGKFEFQEPDNSGGRRKLYDIFLCYLDSARNGNTMWYRRLTDELGGRDPEWSTDGSTILFMKDVNAKTVNAYFPNYQICTMDPEGGHFQMLRKDWQTMNMLLLAPSMSIAGDVAFEVMAGVTSSTNADNTDYKRLGTVVLPKVGFMKSTDSVKALARKMSDCTAPSWSPDGKWLAYVKSSADQMGLGVYIASRDLSTRYCVYEPMTGVQVLTCAPSFSPDSKWLTFSTSDGSIYICQITGNGLRRLTGPGSDRYPAWSKGAITGSGAPKTGTKK